MRSFTSWGLFVVALAGCSFDARVDPSVRIPCATAGDCPAGLTCARRLGRCVSADSSDREGPRLSDVVVRPATVAVGQRFELAFTVTEALGAVPEVVRAQRGELRELTLATGDVLGRSFAFGAVAAGDEPEGDAPLFATLVDTAGNEAVGLPSGTITFDFTPPTLRQASFVAPRGDDGGVVDVRTSEALGVRVVASEAVRAGARLRATAVDCISAPVSFTTSESAAGVLDFRAPAPAGTPGCAYTLTLDGLEDVAGNRASDASLTLGLRYHVLAEAPALSELVPVLVTDGGQVPATVFSAQPGYDELGVAFTVGVSASVLTALFDGQLWPDCALGACVAADAGLVSCLCRRRVRATDGEGLHTLLVTATDAPGQSRSAAVPVRFDFAGPRLVPGTAQLTLTPPPGSPLAAVARMGRGATARLVFSVDEPVAQPMVRTTPWALPFTWTSGSASTFSYVASLGADAGVTGALDVLVDAVDAVGNASTLRLADAGVRLDVEVEAPPSPAAGRDAGIMYLRAPWGDSANPPSFRVQGRAGTVEANALVRAFDGPGGAASELGRATADAQGAFVVALIPADRGAVWLSAVDEAGNESPRVDVKDVEWRATLAGKVVGSVIENPHRLDLRRHFRRSFLQEDSTEPPSYAALATADGVALRAEAALRARPVAPTPSNNFAQGQAVYDRARGVFLRWDANTNSWAMFEFDGKHWDRPRLQDPEADQNPPPFAAPAMVYDERRDKTVLIGAPQSTSSIDTWEWDGASWFLRSRGELVSNSGDLAFDPDRGVVVQFGATPLGSVWDWDGTRWTRRMTSAGLAFSSGTLGYDRARRRLVVWGATSTPQLWELDGVTWQQRTLPTSRPSSVTSITFDEARGQLLFYALGTGFWAWNGTAFTNLPSSALTPDPRLIDYDSRNRRVLAYTGTSGAGALHAWDGVAWARADTTVTSAPATSQGAFLYEPTLDRCVLFGGNTGTSASQLGLWDWDGLQWAQRDGGAAPLGRIASGLVYDSARQVGLLFGGSPTGGFSYDGETWELRPGGWNKRFDAGVGPLARAYHGMAYDEARARTVLFGGELRAGTSVRADGETWEHDVSGWQLRSDAGPSPRLNALMTYDPRRSVTVLYGGTSRNGPPTGELWEWNGTVWARAPDAGVGPRPRETAALVFHDRLGASLLIGGGLGGFSYSSEVWAWDGVAWKDLTPAQPPDSIFYSNDQARSQHSAAYDKARGVVVVHGGQGIVGLTTVELDVDPDDRPGVVARFDFLSATLEPGIDVRSISFGAVAGGRGTIDGGVTDGVRLGVWRNGTFDTVAQNAAGPTSAAAVEWTTTDPDQLGRLLFGRRRELGLALTPVAPNGPTFSSVAADYAEVVVRYQRP